MNKRMFEDEIELNGFVHNVRWQGIWHPAERGGMIDPSWGEHWEIDGNVEVEIFGHWFDAAIFGDEIVNELHEKLDDYMEDFQESMEFLGDRS